MSDKLHPFLRYFYSIMEVHFFDCAHKYVVKRNTSWCIFTFVCTDETAALTRKIEGFLNFCEKSEPFCNDNSLFLAEKSVNDENCCARTYAYSIEVRLVGTVVKNDYCRDKCYRNKTT